MRRQVIAQTAADLTGDGIPELITLTGFQEEDSNAWQMIRLNIQDGASCLSASLVPPEDIGYGPRIWIGSLTSAGSKDLLLSIDSGGSGGIGYYTAYAYADGGYRQIFDSDSYNAAYSYAVTYLDGYTVRAESLANAMVYLVDLSGRDPGYLNEIYQSDGTLKAEISGNVNPLGLLYPADITGDGVYELVAYQRITGLYNADGLGDFINTLAWDGEQFALFNQSVGIFGFDA